jgi:hypothetical protein
MGKKSKAKTSTAKAEKVTPTYLKSGTSFKIGVHDVIRALKVIEERGLLDKFAAAAKRHATSLSVDARTVNFVKDFMVKNNMHDDPIGKHIVNAKMTGNDPFREERQRRLRLAARRSGRMPGLSSAEPGWWAAGAAAGRPEV